MTLPSVKCADDYKAFSTYYMCTHILSTILASILHLARGNEAKFMTDYLEK